MPVGSFTLFQQGLMRWQDGTIDPDSHTLKAVLCTSSQALSSTFVGSSGDCRYADLTAERTTANGYTVGGVTLTGVALSIASTFVKLTSSVWSWTLTGGGITYKYLVIYDDTSANKNLLAFVDMDTGGGSISPGTGTLQYTPDSNGIVRSS